jgi:hypothetical protein
MLTSVSTTDAVTAHDSPPKPSCIIWHLRRTLDENLINVEGIDLRLSSIQITPIVRESRESTYF